MKASIRLDHQLLAVESEHTVHAMLELAAPPPADGGTRASLNLGIVIDRSGSMAGPKLETTKQCVEYLVRRLDPSHHLTLVTYDSEVQLLSAMGPVDVARLEQIIRSIQPGGMTNLSGGWLKGREELARSTTDGPKRIVLLTDGLANVGVTDHSSLVGLATKAAGSGLGTTTIGFGQGFDEEFLTDMANAGGGNSYYAESVDAAPGIFAQEFEGLMSLFAQNVSVEIRPTEEVGILAVLNEFPVVSVPDGMQVSLGDAYGGERRRVIFQLRIPQLARLGVAKVADVVVRYTTTDKEIAAHEMRLPLRVNMVSADEAGSAEPDDEVVEEVVILKSARARKEARKHAQEGEFNFARDVLNQAANDLRDFSFRSTDPQRLEREADALDGFSKRIEGGQFDVAMSKSIHYSAQHLWQRRLRGTDELDELLAARSDGPISDLRSRAQGVLLGVAVGNALGLPFEGRSAAEIAARYPNGWRDVTPRKAELLLDDDVAQTVALAESLIADPFFNADDFAKRLVEWARTNGRGIGVLTQEVIDELASGIPVGRAARVVWERRGGSAAGNGAVMRFSPVALVHHSDPMLLLQAARGQAAVTHHDPRCIWSTVAVTSALALAVRDIPIDLPDLAQALDQAGAPPEIVEAIMTVRGAPLESFELDDPEAMGYTLKAMQVGLWCLEQEPDFEKVLVKIVRAGGDTDTNGAVVGAFMGARVGQEGIPRHWIANVPNIDGLAALADALAGNA